MRPGGSAASRYQILAKAWSRSATMSEMDSRPMERRTRSGVRPLALCCSSVSCECEVLAGVEGEGLRVPDVREVGEEAEALDELLAGGPASLDAEDDHRRRSPW